MQQNSNLPHNVETTVKKTMNNIFGQLEKCIANLENDTGIIIPNVTLGEVCNNQDEQISSRITNGTVNRNEEYMVPTKLDSVETILVHYKSCANELEERNGDKWRKYLNQAERKRSTRIKRIV